MGRAPDEWWQQARKSLTVEEATRGVPPGPKKGRYPCVWHDPGADGPRDSMRVDERGYECATCDRRGDLLELAAEVWGVPQIDIVRMQRAKRVSAKKKAKPAPPPPAPPAPAPPAPLPPPRDRPREHTLDEWLAVLGTRGWTGRRSGREYAGPCPICGGTDRFHVGPGRTRAVVASCRHGCTFAELVEALFRHGDPLPPVRSPAPRDDLDRSKLDHAGLARALVDALDLTSRGKEYVRRRGLDPDRLEEYGWRSVDNAGGWMSLAGLPEAHGWPRWPSGQPRWPLSCHTDGALVLPYRDGRGSLAGVRFRPGKEWRAAYRLRRERSAPKALSMPRGKTQLYGAEALRGLKRGVVHIAEGEIDAESLREHGVVTVGTPGATIWRREWTRRLVQRGPRRAVLWFDDDTAGDRAGRLVRDELADAGLTVLRLVEHGADVNELHASGELAEWIRQSEARSP